MEITKKSILEYRERYYKVLDSFLNGTLNKKQPAITIPSDYGLCIKLIDYKNDFFLVKRGNCYLDKCYNVYKKTIYYNNNFIASFYRESNQIMLFEYKDKNIIEKNKDKAKFIYNNNLIEDALYCYNLKKKILREFKYAGKSKMMLLKDIDFDKTVEMVLNEDDADSVVIKFQDKNTNKINYLIENKQYVNVYNKDKDYIIKIFNTAYKGLLINVVVNENLKKFILEKEI